MAGIKETREVLKLLEDLADAIEKAKSDGSIDWFDLPKLGGVVSSAKKAMDGSHLIDDELRDLDADEIKVLINDAVSAATAITKAFLSR